MYARVCVHACLVCVCVCVNREREGEREGEQETETERGKRKRVYALFGKVELDERDEARLRK